MFKIIANVGAWETLYVSSQASGSLRRFLPNDVSYAKGKLAIAQDHDLLVERLLISGEGARPRVIVLISEGGAGMGIASRIKAELGSSLAAILDAKTLADSVRSQREVNQFCEQLDVAMVADHERSLNRKRESKQATSAAKTAKILSIIGLAAATASIFLPYLLDGSKPQQQTNSAELKLDISNLGEKIADLELRHARSTVQISELSGHSHVNADSKFAKQIKDLEQRVLLYEKALTKGRQEIFAESIEVELRSNSRMPKQGNVVSLTASDSEGSYLLRERSLDLSLIHI